MDQNVMLCGNFYILTTKISIIHISNINTKEQNQAKETCFPNQFLSI